MKPIAAALLLVLVQLATGCTHAYSLAPDPSLLPAPAEDPHPLAVHWEPTEAEMQLVEQRATGGGDSIEYSTYRDLAPSIDQVLGNCFEEVVPDPAQADVVFRFRILTTPSWGIGMIWPPSELGITFDTRAFDASGAEIWHTTVSGSRKVSFGQIQDNFSAAGQMGAVEAMKALQRALLESPELRAVVAATGP